MLLVHFIVVLRSVLYGYARQQHLNPTHIKKRIRITENCAFVGCYAASRGNFSLTLQDNLSVPSLGFKNPKEFL